MDNNELESEQSRLSETYSSLLFLIDSIVEEIRIPKDLRVTSDTNRDEIGQMVLEQNQFDLMNRHKRENLYLYKNLQPQVYFARIDIKFKNSIKSHYISKTGLSYLGTEDWRSDIGSLVYDVVSSHYLDKHPIVIKRDFDISYDRLRSYRDLIKPNTTLPKDSNEMMDLSETNARGGIEKDVLITDPFLIKVLEQKKSDRRFTDIITTIQKEQNKIIRQPYNHNACVLGCAGSGKTMILLHHLSYLKYQTVVYFSKVKILTPNPAFMKAFEGLKRDLDIADIEMITVFEYYTRLLRRFKIDLRNVVQQSEYDIKEKELLKTIYSVDTTSWLFKRYRQDLERIGRKVGLFIPQSISPLEKYSMLLAYYHQAKTRFEEESTRLRKQIIQMGEANRENFLDTLQTLFELNDSPIHKEWNQTNRNSGFNSLVQMIFRIIAFGPMDSKVFDQYKGKTIKEIDETAFREQMRAAQSNHQVLIDQLQEKQQLENELNSQLDQLSLSIPSLSDLSADLIQKIDRNQEALGGLTLFHFFEKIRIKLENQNDQTRLNECRRSLATLENEREHVKKTKAAIQQEIGELESLIKHSSERIAQGSLMIEKLDRIQAFKQTIALYGQRLDVWEADSQSLRNFKSVVHLKQWFDNVFINEYIVGLFQAAGNQTPSEFEGYNFYFMYLLMLLNTYQAGGSQGTNQDILICIDEFQDLSIQEIQLFRELNVGVTLKLYGDLNQRLLSKGIVHESEIPKSFQIYKLNINYRNTFPVTSFYNRVLRKYDHPVGVVGPEVHSESMASVKKAIISSDHTIFICMRSLVGNVKKIIKNMNVLSVEEVKGMEYQTVYVLEKDMTDNERYIAYSRATFQLIIVQENK